jgi:hypothetical protein
VNTRHVTRSDSDSDSDSDRHVTASSAIPSRSVERLANVLGGFGGELNLRHAWPCHGLRWPNEAKFTMVRLGCQKSCGMCANTLSSSVTYDFISGVTYSSTNVGKTE